MPPVPIKKPTSATDNDLYSAELELNTVVDTGGKRSSVLFSHSRISSRFGVEISSPKLNSESRTPIQLLIAVLS